MEIGYHTIRKKIMSAAAIVGAFTILAQIGGFGKELTVAARYGIGDALDAFLIAFLIPSFVVNVIGSSLSSAFLPTFIQAYKNQDAATAQNILSSAIGWFIFLSLTLSFLIVIIAPQIVLTLCGGFTIHKIELTKDLLYFLLPIILLKGVTSIWAGVLNALDSFALPAAVPVLGPLSVIILILGAGTSLGIFALVFGTLIGFGLEAMLMGTAVVKRNFSIRPRLHWSNPEIKTIFRQFLPVVAGALIMCSAEIVDKGMAGALSPGSVAALNYGNRIIAAVLTLATTAIGTALLPYFSRMVAEGKWKDIRRTIRFYLGLTFVFGIPAAIIIFGISENIIQLVFQRGSFTSHDTGMVAPVQALFALQIPFYVASIVIVRFISSMRANHLLMWGSAINLFVNIVLNIVFINLLGLKGIALSTSCVYAVSFLFLFYFANKQVLREENK